MMDLLVWVASTISMLLVCTIAQNLIEVTVHRYALRMTTMSLVGIAIGAVASAIGYGFLLLAMFMLWRCFAVRAKLRALMGSMATRYMLPGMMLVLFATACSYVFSIEECPDVASGCHRVFFERAYTPPHLAKPVH